MRSGVISLSFLYPLSFLFSSVAAQQKATDDVSLTVCLLECVGYVQKVAGCNDIEACICMQRPHFDAFEVCTRAACKLSQLEAHNAVSRMCGMPVNNATSSVSSTGASQSATSHATSASPSHTGHTSDAIRSGVLLSLPYMAFAIFIIIFFDDFGR